jgi:hypothetical protein
MRNAGRGRPFNWSGESLAKGGVGSMTWLDLVLVLP